MNAPVDPRHGDAQLVVGAMLWSLATRYGGKLINLLTTIVLAWLLTQEDFGLAGYALVFVTFIEILEGVGVESALIYHGEDEELQNNALWISAVAGLLISLTVYLTAPLAAILFADERVIPLLQVLSLAFVLTGLRTVPKAILIRHMRFKLMAIPEIVKVTIKGAAAISLAFGGAGAWSLIVSVVIGLAAELVALWAVCGWRPTFRFTFLGEKVKPLVSYGGGLVGMSVTGTLINNVDYVLVGRVLGPAALGAYMVGFRLPTLLIMPMISSLSKILFPISVRRKADPVAMVAGWKHALRYLSIFTVPVGVGIASVSHVLVPAVFGEKWIDAVPVVSGIALQTVLISMLWHVGDIYKALGRIRMLFRLSVLQLLITAPLLVVAVNVYGTIGAVAYAHVTAAGLTLLARLWHISRLMPVSKREILSILLHPVLAGAVMALAIAVLDAALVSHRYGTWSRLLLDTGFGALVYGCLAALTMRGELSNLVLQLRMKLGTR